MITESIFKRDANGSIRVWWAEIEGAAWRSYSGVMNGNNVVSEWTICYGKQNRSDEEQAKFEAYAEQTKKLRIDYRPNIHDVDVPRGSMIKPMLAQKYESFPGRCFIQPKFDGGRMLANKDGLWSRTGIKINSCPHIEELLEPFFKTNPDTILDGEAYNHELKADFNEIMSIWKRTVLGPEELYKSRQKIQYHVYDMFWLKKPEQSFYTRHYLLIRLFNSAQLNMTDFIKLAETRICIDEMQILNAHEEFLEEGYEGTMVRLDRPYDQKRSKSLLKLKTLQTEEFELVCLEEGQGNWSGAAKSAIVRLPDGRTCGVGIAGTMDHMKKLLLDQRNGTVYQSVTVRYLNLTPDGKLRGGIAKEFNDGVIEDRPPLPSLF